MSEARRFVERLKPRQLEEIGSAYLSQLSEEARKSPRFTDKLPHNFELLGLIRLVFPNASIVHVRRDPLDNCLSMFKANFAAEKLAFTYDLTDLGRYHNLYRRLMNHWRSVMTGQFFEIDYEALVSDPEPATRALFDYCGLDWSPDVLAIEKSTREVQTIASPRSVGPSTPARSAPHRVTATGSTRCGQRSRNTRAEWSPAAPVFRRAAHGPRRPAPRYSPNRSASASGARAALQPAHRR